VTVPTQGDGRTINLNLDRRSDATAVPPADDAASGRAEQSVRSTRPWRSAFAAAVPAWLAGTLLVLALAELAARADQDRGVLGLSPVFAHESLRALFMWDTNWYVALAEHGYAGNSHEAIRFSPLLPLTTRAVSALGIPAPAAILLLCWLAALGFAVLVHRLTLLETNSVLMARRATWLSQLAPGAFVLTMGYTEALSGLLAAAYLLAVRQYGADRRASRLWLWCVVGCVAGFGSGLVRPTGFLIAVVGGLELLMRLIRRESLSVTDWTARLAMTISPVIGVGSFLWWCHHVNGDYLLPYREQTAGGLRGGVASNPWTSAWQMFAVPTTRGENGGTGMMTLVLVVASVGLLWACIRRLPLSLSAWAALSLAAALTAPFFSSFPRYVSGDIPVVIAAATLPRSRGAWLWTVGASAALCAFFAYRAFTGTYTP
jgi:hypothetical protein